MKITAENRMSRWYIGAILGVVIITACVFFLLAFREIRKVSESLSAAGVHSEDELFPVFDRMMEDIAWLFLGFLLFSAGGVFILCRHYSRRMRNFLEEARRSERSFISNASHELNNPLTAIQGECEIALMKERNSEQYKESLYRISTETKRIIQMIKQLLFISLGDKEILKNSIEPILLVDFLSQFQVNEVSFSPDSYILTVNANPYLLKIAIGNILGNARKYSDGKPVILRLSGTVLEIEDHGIGIPQEELKHIQQPFFRASNARGYAGHGIGLSLSLKILQAYGAKIVVTSEVGVGTKFQIDFYPKEC